MVPSLPAGKALKVDFAHLPAPSAKAAAEDARRRLGSAAAAGGAGRPRAGPAQIVDADDLGRRQRRLAGRRDDRHLRAAPGKRV